MIILLPYYLLLIASLHNISNSSVSTHLGSCLRALPLVVYIVMLKLGNYNQNMIFNVRKQSEGVNQVITKHREMTFSDNKVFNQ